MSANGRASILRCMTDALVDDEVMRFGEVAVELGCVSTDDISVALARQAHRDPRAFLVLDRCVVLDAPTARARSSRPAAKRKPSALPTAQPVEPSPRVHAVMLGAQLEDQLARERGRRT